MQEDEFGKKHVVGYASRKMKPRETRYGASERELLAIIFSIDQFRYYLLGGPTFQIILDHAALQYLHTMKAKNGRIARWAYALEELNYELVHKPGVSIGHADGLSRMVQAISVQDVFDIQKAQKKDAYCAVKINSPSFSLIDGVLHKKTIRGPRVVLPVSLKNDIFRQYHDSKLACHASEKKMNKIISGLYWWPRRRKDVAAYVERCDECQKRRKTGQIKIPLQELPETRRPFERVGMDITLLPKSEDGYTCVLTILDHFSRYLVMVPLKNQEASTVARALVFEFILKFGCPISVITDHGKNFLSK